MSNHRWSWDILVLHTSGRSSPWLRGVGWGWMVGGWVSVGWARSALFGVGGDPWLCLFLCSYAHRSSPRWGGWVVVVRQLLNRLDLCAQGSRNRWWRWAWFGTLLFVSLSCLPWFRVASVLGILLLRQGFTRASSWLTLPGLGRYVMHGGLHLKRMSYDYWCQADSI
jgi:hypothetical protein